MTPAPPPPDLSERPHHKGAHMTYESTADEKDRLIRDIRRHLPFVAMGHPALAQEIGRAMDVVEQKRPIGVALLAADQSILAVGVEVEAPPHLDGTPRYGLIVQMGDEDIRPGCVLLYEGPDSEYPAWWSAEAVRPLYAAPALLSDTEASR